MVLSFCIYCRKKDDCISASFFGIIKKKTGKAYFYLLIYLCSGLARKEDFPFITYYCPHCHALNKPKQLDGSISSLPSPKAGSVQMDEGILGLPSPKARSPKTGDGEAVLNASTSAAESIITSDSPVNAIPEIEEVSERASLEEKID
jgi:hypothetical protein